MASGSQWFYVVGSERKGPLTADQMAALRSAGVIDEATLVWTDGMAGWAPLSDTPLHAGPNFPPVPGASPYAGAGAETIYDPPVAGFGEAISTCFRKYVTFSGRANRPEFWWFTLFGVLGGIAASIVDAAIFRSADYGPLNGLFSLAMLLPSLAVSIRRLHDTDRRGWWVLLHFVPLIGTIILIIWFCGRGTPGRNRFG